MFSNYGTAMGTLFKGILMLAACSGCYLVWWGVAFYPERHVPLWLSGILLVATAACGIMAVNWMAQGIFSGREGACRNSWWMDSGWWCDWLCCFVGNQ